MSVDRLSRLGWSARTASRDGINITYENYRQLYAAAGMREIRWGETESF